MKRIYKIALSLLIAGGLMLSVFSLKAYAYDINDLSNYTYKTVILYDTNNNGILDSTETVYIYYCNTYITATINNLSSPHNYSIKPDITTGSVMYAYQMWDQGGNRLNLTIDNQSMDSTGTSGASTSTYFKVIDGNVLGKDSLGNAVYTPYPMLPDDQAYINITQPTENSKYAVTNGNDDGTGQHCYGNLLIQFNYDLPLRDDQNDGTKTQIQVKHGGGDGINIPTGMVSESFDNLVPWVYVGTKTNYTDPYVKIDTKRNAIITNDYTIDTGHITGTVNFVQGWLFVGKQYIQVCVTVPGGKTWTKGVWVEMVAGFVDSNGDGKDDRTGQTQDDIDNGNNVIIDTSGGTPANENYTNVDFGQLVNNVIHGLVDVFQWIPQFSILISYCYGWLPLEIKDLLYLAVAVSVIAFCIRVFRGS